MERIVGQLRAKWPKVRMTLRADSSFAREALMKWCEEHTCCTRLASISTVVQMTPFRSPPESLIGATCACCVSIFVSKYKC